MRQSELWIEDESERTHGSGETRLAGERETLDLRTILRHQPEYSDNIRSIERSDIEQERPGRSCVCAVDWKYVFDQRECRQCLPHWSDTAGDSEGDEPIRHLARIGRECSLQSRCRAANCGDWRQRLQHRRRQ